jgi:hypothetical protein
MLYELEKFSYTKSKEDIMEPNRLNRSGKADINYVFSTPSKVDYVVEAVIESGILDVGFQAKQKGKKFSYKTVVNKGEYYSIMATVTDIIKDVIKEYGSKFNIRKLAFTPSEKDDSDKGEDNQRYRAYKRHIEKNMPFLSDVQMDEFNGRVTANIKSYDNTGDQTS